MANPRWKKTRDFDFASGSGTRVGKSWVSLSVLQHVPFCFGWTHVFQLELIETIYIVPWPVFVEVHLAIFGSSHSSLAGHKFISQPPVGCKLLWPDTWLVQLG